MVSKMHHFVCCIGSHFGLYLFAHVPFLLHTLHEPLVTFISTDGAQVLDLDRPEAGWQPLAASAYDGLDGVDRLAMGRAAFFPAAAMSARVVCRLEVAVP